MVIEKVETRTALLWKDENAIFWIKPQPGVIMDKEDIADNFLVTRTITGKIPHLKILDAREKWKMTREAEVYFKQEDVPERTIARAILVKSVADKLIKFFLVKLYKPEVPLNFFISEKEAVKWLLGFKK